MKLVSMHMAAEGLLLSEFAAEVALPMQVHVPIFHRRWLNSEMILGIVLVFLTCRPWTVADTPSRVSHMCTTHRRCTKIFCAASHSVGDNKLCAIYLIFRLDLSYIMGSQRPWTLFELLDLLSAVMIKELELFRVRLDILYIKLVF